jgi:2-phospho-L-lactate guanylyltransferase
VVLVPVKALDEAKSRLRGVLSDGARAGLVRAMLADVLAAVRGAHDGPVRVVSSDGAYDDLARRFVAERLPDAGGGYNAAVLGALRSEEVQRAGAALIVPADLPGATSEDLARTIEALRRVEVVLVPAVDGGTGALGLRPPDAIGPTFGPDSAEAHRRAAVAAGRRIEVLELASLARDVDTLADLVAGASPPSPALPHKGGGGFGEATTGWIGKHAEELAEGVARGRG